MIDLIKNNESLKNINLKTLLILTKYLISEETSVINNNHENSYSLVSVNGQCLFLKMIKLKLLKF